MIFERIMMYSPYTPDCIYFWMRVERSPEMYTTLALDMLPGRRSARRGMCEGLVSDAVAATR